MDVYFYLANPDVEISPRRLAGEWCRAMFGTSMCPSKAQLDDTIRDVHKQIEHMQGGTHTVHDLLVIERYRVLADALRSMYVFDTPAR